MKPSVIKTHEDYKAVLQEAEDLVARDPAAGTTDADRLQLLTLLVEDFERRHFAFPNPDPIDAIEFRMGEQGLRQKDLVPLLGSRSRVSEVLARKRPLTVQMIRALSTGLGIPAEVLVGEPQNKTAHVDTDDEIDLKKFPVREMEKRGWFKSLKISVQTSPEERVRAFLAQIGGRTPAYALYRRTFRGDEVSSKSYYSVLAWTARVLIRAKDLEKSVSGKFEPGRISPNVLRELAQLSWFSQGPALVEEFLAKRGIVFIVEPRLPNTLIDGAALLTERGTPVIAMTLRYDRIDYFWYTLLHELVHIWKHLNRVDEAFIDRVENAESMNAIEKEANRFARDALIPRAVWKRSQAFMAPTKESILQLADNVHVHPAVVVGRLQNETGRYDSFRDLLGQGEVRKLFSDLVFAS
jgi:HTH-type transcriptional regulator / antitoxin HigA